MYNIILVTYPFSITQVRKLEYLLADAVERGCKHVITCGSFQSNHCRATSIACAQLGLQCHLYLRSAITVSVAVVGVV